MISTEHFNTCECSDSNNSKVRSARHLMRQTAPEVNARGERLQAYDVQIRAIYERERVRVLHHDRLPPLKVEVPERP